VSSLVHSSTLVTAGIYFLIRYFSSIPFFVLERLAVLAGLTLLVSRVAALAGQDFKKIIALSTLRQLSFMGVILGLGYPKLALFHLITHAIFKSCLFIGAGSYLHLSQSNQDMRRRINSKLR
jgi:NADH-ubiquinone oxidoreductase chain 5